MQYTTEVRVDLDPSNRDDWDRLVDEARASVFYRYDVLEGYHRSGMQEQLAQAYVVVRGASCCKTLAIVPAYILASLDPYSDFKECSELSSLRSKRSVVSHFCHCYDSTMVAAQLDYDLVRTAREALRALAIRWKASSYGFMNVDGEDPRFCYLEQSGLRRYVLPPRYRMSLSGFSTMEDYLSVLRSHVRYELQRQWRRAHEAGTKITVGSPGEVDLGEVVTLCRRTAARYASEHFYPASAFEELLHRIAACTRIVTVRVEDRLVSAWVCLVDRDSLHTWAAGARYDLSRFSPYYVGFFACVRYAILNRFQIFEGGRANAKFKLRHNLEPVKLYAFLDQLD